MPLPQIYNKIKEIINMISYRSFIGKMYRAREGVIIKVTKAERGPAWEIRDPSTGDLMARIAATKAEWQELLRKTVG